MRNLKAYLSILIFLLLSASANAHSPVYATAPLTHSASSSIWLPILGTIVINDVNSPHDARTSDNSTYAELQSRMDDAWIQLNYATTVAGGTTSFIRIDGSNTSSLTVNAYLNGTLRVSPDFSIVRDQNNYTYIAITPTTSYNSLRVTLSIPNFQFTLTTVRVYHAFYNSPSLADCLTGWYTNLGESAAGAATASSVQSPTLAVDNNLPTFSKLQVAAHQPNIEVSQTIFFPTISAQTDRIKLITSVSNLFNPATFTVTAQTYRGLTAFGPLENISSQVNVSANTRVAVYLNPGTNVDRVKITIKATSNVNQTAHVNLHEVQLVPPPPVLVQNTFTSCPGPISLAVSNPEAGLEYRWYYNNTLVSGTASYAANLSTAASPHILKVAAVKTGCSIESEMTTATITINPIPLPPAITVATAN